MRKRILVAILLLAGSVMVLAQQARELNLRGDRFKPLTWEQLTPDQKVMVNDLFSGSRTTMNGPFNVLLRSPGNGQRLAEARRLPALPYGGASTPERDGDSDDRPVVVVASTNGRRTRRWP